MVVNSTSSFFNHKLDTESSKLTTFGTPFGIYRYLRMPMGVSLSSDIYQYKVDGHLKGIRNCVAIADDIIIFRFDKSGSDHDRMVLEVMDKARSDHFGVDCTKLRARDSIYWPHIGWDVENLVKTCEKCQEFSRRNKRDPAIPRELPLVTWTLLELDLFTFENGTFLLIVGMTSRFPVVRVLSNESSRSVLNALKGVYCDFGLPKRVLTDNGPCFR